MGYVIAAILVVLIVAVGIAVFVRSATARKGQAQIASPDEGTPLGDTEQHAGEQSTHLTSSSGTGEWGATVDDPESTSREPKPPSPGVGGPGEGGVGGEGEGSRPVPQPESERLSNRPR
jgi:hypothetical protein